MTNRVRVYIYDTDGAYQPITGIEQVRFSTIYNGGYGDCSFFVTSAQAMYIRPNYRVMVRNGLTIIWDGLVSGVTRNPSRGRGVGVQAQGHFAAWLDRRQWAKRWSNSDITDTSWPYRLTESGDGQGNVKRDANTLRLEAKTGAVWANTDNIGCDYFAIDGETIKRITFDYDFQEQAQSWSARLYDVTNATFLWTQSATGTGSQDISISPASTNLLFSLRSEAAQTAPDNIYSEISNLVVYTETGDIDATAIAGDIAGYVTELNSTSDIANISTDLTPFGYSRATSLNRMLSDALSYGDASFNTYAYGIRPPNFVTRDTPQLFVEQYPDTTDYDYELSINDLNLVGDFSFTRDVSDVINYVRVVYTDPDGKQQTVTPSDDSNLTDTDSEADWGRRDGVITVPGVSNQTNAVQVGRRYLANKKDPQWKLDSPIQIRGYVLTKAGGRLPCSQIKAGKRIRLKSNMQTFDNWIFVISRTRYDDDQQLATIEVGEPLTFDILLAQLARRTA